MEETNFNQRTDLSDLKESIEKVRTEIKKIIVGQEKIIDILILLF